MQRKNEWNTYNKEVQLHTHVQVDYLTQYKISHTCEYEFWGLLASIIYFQFLYCFQAFIKFIIFLLILFLQLNNILRVRLIECRIESCSLCGD